MNTWKTWSVLTGIALSLGCGERKMPFLAPGGSIVSGEETSEDTASPDENPDEGGGTDDATPDGETDEGRPDSALFMDTGEEGEEAYNNPGDTRNAEQSDDGSLTIDLTDSSGDSNQDQEFYLVLVNAGSDEIGYTLRYVRTAEVDEEDEEEGEAEAGGGAPDEGGGAPGGGEGGGEPGGGEGGGGPGGGEGGGGPGGGEGGGGEGGGGPGGGGAPIPLPALSGISALSLDAVSPGLSKALLGDVGGLASSVFVPATTSDSPPPPPTSGWELSETDIGVARDNFKIRAHPDDEDTCPGVDVVLWALGDNAAIWVDEDIPIDYYYDCDDRDGGGSELSDYETYEFNNCDLQTIVDIVDTNIMPNVTALLGEPSDVNGDGRVAIVISETLNFITFQEDDDDDKAEMVEAYTDPETDLEDWSEDDNKCSDEQEVIFVFAPDEDASVNPAYGPVTVDEYTGMALAGRIVQGMVELISYNQHVLVNESEAEETWVTKGISAVVADMLGFGAIYYDDAWDYMDAPHLYSLTDGNEDSADCSDGDTGSMGGGEAGGEGEGEGGAPPSKTEDEDSVLSTATRGPQYLFFRWLVDAHGSDILSTLVQTDKVGLCNIEEATEEELKDLAVAWQVALLTTGVENIEGNALMDTDEWDMYNSPALITAPTSDPEEGDYYGANGYQRGIDVAGSNLYMDEGTTDEPSEIEDNAVKLSNTDYFTFVPGVPFYGYVAGAYGAHVVRVTDIPYREATLEVQASSGDLKGVLIRWNDPERKDFKVEDVFSTLDANNMPLPDLLDDGSEITGMGTISAAGGTYIAGDDELKDVYDVDRWLLDLTDRDADEEVDVVITVDRRYENGDGDLSPYDVWAAVVPEDLLPTPTYDGTRRGDCEEGDDFGYPSLLLEYLFYQMLLSNESGTGGVTDGFDACGTPQTAMSDTGTSEDTAWEPPTCGADWDRDEVLDVDEPRPSSLLEQVMVMQCTQAGGDWSAVEPYEAEDLFDEDSLDANDEPYVDRVRNLGGQSGDSDEEAYLETTLTGGSKYVIVVGAGTEEGPYELRVKQIDD